MRMLFRCAGAFGIAALLVIDTTLVVAGLKKFERKAVS